MASSCKQMVRMATKSRTAQRSLRAGITLLQVFSVVGFVSCCHWFRVSLQISTMPSPLSSDRQCLSCQSRVWHLCTVISTHMSSSYSCLDWICHTWSITWIYAFVCVYFVSYFAVLLWARSGGLDGIEAWPLRTIFLQCFDSVGLVIWPLTTHLWYDLQWAWVEC